jgi:hypothetical protein
MGQHGPAGKDGSKGDPGVDGIDGLDGVSVTDTWIAADNHLVVKLSNGKEIDAGLLDTQSGGNIISTQVSSVEPSWSRNFMIMGS